MSQYIPDLTERFPEGYDGVDMTPSYFGGEVDWSRAIKEDDYDDYLDNPEEKQPSLFRIGNEYEDVGIYGGITTYKVKVIDREHQRILLGEEWRDIDGEGIRPAEWHKLETDEEGDRALLYTSKTYGDIWLYA